MRTRLEGRRVLVVEDEFLIAHETATALADAGALVVGPCATAGDALRLLEHEPVDIAVLDVLLQDGDTTGVAMALDERGIPYVLATAAEAPLIPPFGACAPVVPKPADFTMLIAVLCRQLERAVPGGPRLRDAVL